MFYFHEVAYVQYLGEVDIFAHMSKKFIHLYNSAKIIKIDRYFPKLWSQMYCHLFYGSQCICIDRLIMRWWSIRIVWSSQRSLLPLRVFRMLCYPVLALTSSFVTLSFQETPDMLLSHLWWAASIRFDSVTVSGHSSALYRRVDKMTDSYSRIFTFRLFLLFFQIFFISPKTVAAFPMLTLTSFCSFRCMQCSYQGRLEKNWKRRLIAELLLF